MTLLERYSTERLSLGDLEVLRLILRGDSVIDWKKLHLSTPAEVDAFLRTNLFDPDSTEDMRRLSAILKQSVEYLRKTFRYRVADPVANPAHVRDLFLIASGVMEPQRLRRIACVVLKVMHTVHHVEARELLFRTRISEVELALMVDQRVREVVGALQKSGGLPIVEFEGSPKTRNSVITKLIAKRESVAAQVYDKHRFRIVVRDQSSVVPLVLGLAEQLFPFNYVVPGQTANSLFSLEDVLRRDPRLVALGRHLQHEDEHGAPPAANEFSGATYRVLNFIVDLPMRIDATALATRRDGDPDLGRVVFAPVELQVLDLATRELNESGENAHAKYKKRQLRRVLGRLSRGLVVPRVLKKPPTRADL